jgi:hypothetical protein
LGDLTAGLLRANGPLKEQEAHSVDRHASGPPKLCVALPKTDGDRTHVALGPSTVIRSPPGSAPRLPIAVIPSDAVPCTSSAWPSPQRALSSRRWNCYGSRRSKHVGRRFAACVPDHAMAHSRPAVVFPTRPSGAAGATPRLNATGSLTIVG